MRAQRNPIAVFCLFLTLTCSVFAHASQKRATIYFIRGGPIDFGTYPTSNTILGSFLKDGKRLGYSSLVARQGWWPTSPIACTEIASNKKRGKVILVGHSFGANGAIVIAQCLKAYGIDVALLATIDIIPNPRLLLNPYSKIPDNVEIVWNYYQQQDPSLLWGHPCARRSGNNENVHNVRVRLPKNFAAHNHVDDAATPEIVKTVRRVLEAE